jgi:nucleotide-binding universal stress UspA family protein
MMKILLAVDGSPCSEDAVAEVAHRPWPTGSEVRIITAFEPLVTPVPETWVLSPDYFEEIEKSLREQAQVTAAEAAARILGGEDKSLKITAVINEGSPKRVIIEEAEKWGADLTVVGSHGYRRWERILLGSVSQAVALHAACSVEIVRSPRAGEKELK